MHIAGEDQSSLKGLSKNKPMGPKKIKTIEKKSVRPKKIEKLINKNYQ